LLPQMKNNKLVAVKAFLTVLQVFLGKIKTKNIRKRFYIKEKCDEIIYFLTYIVFLLTKDRNY